MRIRVLLDVWLPLKTRKKIRMEDGAWAYIEFKYERMGTFCFLCGQMGHFDHFCNILFKTQSEELEKGWGPWMRALTRRASGTGGERWLREEGEAISGGPKSGTVVDKEVGV